MGERALDGIRVCDLSGQLAGAGATRFLAAFGAQVIRVEDPVRQGGWDILRGGRPYVDERRGRELGGAFNNHNVGKLGVTIDLRSPKGRDLFTRLVEVSDVVTENFAAGVLAGLGFPYERLHEINPSVIYVSNSGFGHTGPYAHYKSWGPIVQALSGLTFTSGLAGHPPAGWGFSYMDHMGANFMALAVLAALVHRNRTGEGQWVDLAMTEVGLTLVGPALLDATVHERPMRTGRPTGQQPQRLAGDGTAWCVPGARRRLLDGDRLSRRCRLGRARRGDRRRMGMGRLDSSHSRVVCRARKSSTVVVLAWTATHDRHELATRIRRAGVPAEAVQRPSDRIDHDVDTAAWGLWPTVSHPHDGRGSRRRTPAASVSRTDWHMETGAPMLGQHNEADLLRPAGARPGRARGAARRRGHLMVGGAERCAGGGAGERARRVRRQAHGRSRCRCHRRRTDRRPSIETLRTLCRRRTRRRRTRSGAELVVVALQHEQAGGHGRSRRRRRARVVPAALRTRWMWCSRRSSPEGWPRSASTTTISAMRFPGSSGCRSRRSGGQVRARMTRPPDLTLLAGGGAVWSCGYDDHSLPPVRGGGNQAFHIGVDLRRARCTHRVVAPGSVRHRSTRRGERERRSQRLDRARDVRMARRRSRSATANRPARLRPPTLDTTVTAADGRMVNTGVPPRSGKAVSQPVASGSTISVFATSSPRRSFSISARSDQ